MQRHHSNWPTRSRVSSWHFQCLWHIDSFWNKGVTCCAMCGWLWRFLMGRWLKPGAPVYILNYNQCVGDWTLALPKYLATSSFVIRSFTTWNLRRESVVNYTHLRNHKNNNAKISKQAIKPHQRFAVHESTRGDTFIIFVSASWNIFPLNNIIIITTSGIYIFLHYSDVTRASWRFKSPTT